MDDDIQLTELQEDAIVELLNIGMGVAARSLSEMVNEEISLSIPSLEMLSRQNAATHLNGQKPQQIAVIKQCFRGAVWGEALLLFPQDKSLELVQVLMKGVPNEMLDELAQDALVEVGNIILHACLASLANLLAIDLNSDIPFFLTGTANEILGVNTNHVEDDIVMFLQMNFGLPIKDIKGYVAIVLEVSSVAQLKQQLDKYLAQL
jgi:chemotaxis protein CheC